MSAPPKGPFDLSQRKRALFEKLLREEGIRSDGTPRIGRRALEGPIPVSFAQERLWFLDQLDPGNPSYNIPQAVRFRGPFRTDLLERALEEVVRRHEILRPTFSQTDGGPVQVIAPAARLNLPVVDLTSLPESDRGTEVHRIATEGAQRPFDLARGPLLRLTVLRLGPEEAVLLWNLHHIVSDGWSAGILMREAAALYDAFSRDEPSPLPELPIQYADFAAGQRGWLRGEVLESQLRYWRSQLAGGPDDLRLPTDRPRPPLPSSRGTHEGFSLPRDLARELRALGLREGATPFMVLLAAFKTLLHRYSGQEEISVGTLIANRNRVEIEELIGFFANTLVLRSSLAGSPTFRELLGRVREVTLGAYAHQDIPFEKIVEELHPDRDPGRNPFFQVMFVLQNARAGDVGFAGVDVTPIETETGTARFDLSLAMSEVEPDLHGWFEYRTDLFDAVTIARMIGHWEALLAAIVENPDERIARLTVMVAAERRRLLVEWNDTARESPQKGCVHELFEAQVARTPDAVSVVLGGEKLSYGELDARAEQVATLLRRLGVGPDSIVGISMERSLEVIVAVLGALKAGGACLPIDPAYPGERQAFMLEESRASVVLTQRRLASGIPSREAKVVCLDGALPDAHPSQPPVSWRRAVPGNLAYVIYTSGSTGRPKGIGMPHASLVNLVEWHQSAPVRSARTLQYASLGFDVSFEEIFSTFRSGGMLVLVPEASHVDVAALVRILEEQRVERAHLPNVMLQRLAEDFARRPGTLECLREIMVGGEQLRLTPAIVDLFRRLPRCALHNHYGPSETHVMTSFVLEGDPRSWPALPPIGRPIDNTRAYVLDRHMQPVPIGVPGELYIGGDCVARGYIDRPDVTAERFVPDDLDGRPGDRLYRSGDLCRYRADGAIEFIGRADHQVKIRGVRVEPAEIEVVLGRHPGVKESAVVAWEEASGGKRLVAYVVPAPGEAPLGGELRRHLRDHLPETMMPAAFVLRGAFPRTPSGKVDRKSLPPPDWTRLEASEPFAAPRTALEGRLVSIWAALLGLERVGVHESFFDLGGHSLLATQLLSRVREALEVEIPLRGFFETPTVAGLARLVEEGSQAEGVGPISIPAVPRGRSLEQLMREVEELSEDAVRGRLQEGGKGNAK